ncbi:hypothetical protein SAMN05720761_12649 [Fibrobacter sp. UWCM]|uniref:enterotoxin domain protein n=1 Tax=Fibrobacter sp. UWCM TaxID=1896208 RepID=UPI0009212E58|nr:enterotoxin domain protein [Fibrobacter sp. UWCM]SHH78160.1 hypothetical protein SAMN05720761_12649 [Fibrobacter sp. UWCM]
MTRLTEIRLTKFGKIIFAVGCLIPIGIAILISLFFLGGMKVREIDGKWINEGVSDVFKKKSFSYDKVLVFANELTVRDHEKQFSIMGSLGKQQLVSLNTNDGGKNWILTGADTAIYFNENVDEWKYFGDAVFGGTIGNIYVRKQDSLLNERTIILEGLKSPSSNLSNLCKRWGQIYAQNNNDWVVCGYDNTSSSIHEVRILQRLEGVFKLHTSFPNKWHFFRLEYMNPSDFYVNGNLMIGIFGFHIGTGTLLHYLYYSVDGGKSWENEKIPAFSHERLLVTKDSIVVLGITEIHDEKRANVTILSMPIPKE